MQNQPVIITLPLAMIPSSSWAESLMQAVMGSLAGEELSLHPYVPPPAGGMVVIVWKTAMMNSMSRGRESPLYGQVVLMALAHGETFFTCLKAVPRLITGQRKPWLCSSGLA